VTDTKNIIRSVGAYLPTRVMTNDELAKIVDTSDEWIQQRTGIKQRHVAAEGENTYDLAAAAGRKALENAGLEIADIDLIIVATTTPDMTFPATAAVVQQKLGMHHGAAFDIQAVCSGFVYAVATADS
jgi:3-oxoacyl-[acyl-carrier-protein] synthase-3